LNGRRRPSQRQAKPAGSTGVSHEADAVWAALAGGKPSQGARASQRGGKIFADGNISAIVAGFAHEIQVKENSSTGRQTAPKAEPAGMLVANACGVLNAAKIKSQLVGVVEKIMS
jgi:hypothetical protein